MGDLSVLGGGEPEGGRCLWAGLSFSITFNLSSIPLTPLFPGHPGALGLILSLFLAAGNANGGSTTFWGVRRAKEKGRP